MDVDDRPAQDAANPDERLPGSSFVSFLLFMHSIAEAVADKLTEDPGEMYDGEREGGDLRNETSYKRPAESSVPPESRESPESKKFKPEEEMEQQQAENDEAADNLQQQVEQFD